MSVCADANITGTFLHFWTHKVHYNLQQSTLQNFDDGGLLSGWSFVRTPDRAFASSDACLQVSCPTVPVKIQPAGAPSWRQFIVITVKKWLKSVYIYGSYCKIKTGVSLFWTTR